MTDTNDPGHRGLTAVADALERDAPDHQDNGARRPSPPTARAKVGFDPHNDPRDPEPEAGPSVLGVEAGKAIALACEVAARDIEKTADSLTTMASEIGEEARALAAALRARGSRVQDRIENFSELAKRVSNTMRATNERVLIEQGAAEVRRFAPVRS
jgi:hypothetical protein